MSAYLVAKICDELSRTGPVTVDRVLEALRGYAAGLRAAGDGHRAFTVAELAADLRDGRVGLPTRRTLSQIVAAERAAFIRGDRT